FVVTQTERQDAKLSQVARLIGVQTQRLAEVVQGSLRIAVLILIVSDRHQIVVAGIFGVVRQGSREMAACLSEVALADVQLRQPGLRFLGGRGWELPPTRQPAQHALSVQGAANLLQESSSGQK